MVILQSIGSDPPFAKQIIKLLMNLFKHRYNSEWDSFQNSIEKAKGKSIIWDDNTTNLSSKQTCIG